MTEEYNPLQHSIVQASVGTWCRYSVDAFVEALFSAILEEITRVHWNVYQHRWGPSWHADEIEDPMIDGIQFTRYYDGCPCEDEDEHRPECRHAKPNFQHEDVQFRWYKYPGRGMSTNKEWTSDEWRAWFQRCLDTVRSFDDKDVIPSLGTPTIDGRRKREYMRKRLEERYPRAFESSLSDEEAAHFRHMFDAFDHVDKLQSPCWKCSENGWGSGGGNYEGGPAGMIARTLHEENDPDGARSCGHVNTDEERATLDERRRKNSDADRARSEQWRKDDEAYEEREERALYERLHRRFGQPLTDDAVGQTPENPI